MTRGLTLVETLVSLALLSAVAVACMGWTSTAARLGAHSQRDAMWRIEAERALALIDEDLLRTGEAQAVVRVQDDVLIVPTRRLVTERRKVVAVATAHYKVEHGRLIAEWLDADGKLVRTRVLVEAGSMELVHEEGAEGDPVRIQVHLVSEGGASVERVCPALAEKSR